MRGDARNSNHQDAKNTKVREDKEETKGNGKAFVVGFLTLSSLTLVFLASWWLNCFPSGDDGEQRVVGERALR